MVLPDDAHAERGADYWADLLANPVGCQKSIVALTSRYRLTKGYDPSSLLAFVPVVLRRQHPRPRLQPTDRALLAALSRLLPRARWSVFVLVASWRDRDHAGCCQGHG